MNIEAEIEKFLEYFKNKPEAETLKRIKYFCFKNLQIQYT